MNIAEFIYSETTINQIFKQARVKIIIYYFAIIIIALAFVFNGFSDLTTDKKIELAIYALLPMLLIWTYAIYRGNKQKRRLFDSFVLLITDTEIIRQQLNTPEIRHLKTDITEIIKYQNGDILIKANSIKDAIGVSSKIDNIAQLEVLLNQILPIKTGVLIPFIQRFGQPILYSFLICLGIFYYSNNTWIVEITGVLLLFCLSYSCFILYGNKNVDKNVRRLLFFMVFPFFSICGRMYAIAALKPIENKEISQNKELIEPVNDDELLNTIEIHLKVPKEEEKDFENGLRNGIQIENIASFIKDLDKPDEIVLTENKVLLEIDYPLNKPFKTELKSFKNGFTRKELVLEIGRRYKQIYAEEEASSAIKTKPMEKRNTRNRNETEGKYGIWGHDLSDLYLMDIEVYRNKEGQIVLRLNVES